MKMIGYKGFDKDLKCRDFQFEVGKEYEHEGKVKLCESGFHFCENPQGVFGHYSPGNGSRFAIVEADEVSDERESDSKRVAKKLKIKSEISVFEMCRIAVDVFFENFGFDKKIESAKTNSAGDCGAASAGNYGAASAGYQGAASAGNYGAARAGNYGAARAGNYGAARAGDSGAASAGYCGAASGKCRLLRCVKCRLPRSGKCRRLRCGKGRLPRRGKCRQPRRGKGRRQRCGKCRRLRCGKCRQLRCGRGW